ncbi:MAG: CHC2 zinc finger domain-containing protein [Bacteroidales bacterium]
MEIPEIKQRLSIHTVLKHYGLQPDRNGMLKCPFHADDTASMKIYPNTNTFNCFGCGKNGDQIEFCTLKEGNKHKGLLKATELTGDVQPINNKPKQSNSQPKGNNTEILSRIFESFRNGLQSPISKRPKAYLQQRNLDLTKLEIGYNSGQFHHHGKLSEADQEACIKAGLLIPYNGSVPNANGTTYTPFAKDCIIFPLKDKSGNIISLYGRSITNNDKSKHYYLKDRSGLYPGYPNPNTTRLILTEAIIDAASLLQIPEITTEYEVLSCYGTNGLTEEHKTAIKEWAGLVDPPTGGEIPQGGKEIIFFFDGDKAGKDAIKKYQVELSELLPGIKLTAVETPESEDINSLLQGHDPEIFTHLLENRKSFLLTEKVEEPEPQPEPIRTIGKLNTRNPEFITYTTDELQIIILGGINLPQLDRLRITLKISRTDTGDPLHSIRHTLDLYHSDYLEKFINKACEQLETGTNVLRLAVAELTEQIEQYRLSKIESLKEQKPKQRQLTEQRQRKAINYLKAPKLMERTNSDIGKTGMIGEENNRLLMYLVFTSRLREQPLHIISLGSSGTGKTYLQEKISELIPEQDKLEITILSENAFYYFDRKELKHKLVLIEDMDGAQDVLYPLRELQSKKRISKTIPIKDSKGNLRTITLQVEGPICLAGTTTRERLFEDNSNRSLLIYLDNSHEHKENIMEYQRKLSAGKVNTKEENELKEFFKDMQTVLKPIHVRNPYAELLKLPEYVFKPLRTNSHYLATIETITFYHQYQRELKTDETTGELYIETTLEDIEWANKLLRDVLLAKADELNQTLRNFYETLKYHVKASGKGVFYSKEIREKLRMNPMTVNRYTRELESRNFIKRTGGNKKAGFEYEIANWEEYTQLQSNINALDEVLNQLKKKYNISITKPDVILNPSETPVN